MAAATVVVVLVGVATVVVVPVDAGVVVVPPEVVPVPDGVVVEPPSPGVGAGVSSAIFSASVSPAISNSSVRLVARSSASFNFASAALICPSNSFT